MGAVTIGLVGALTINPWLGAFVAVGGFIVVAYNLEAFGGRFHGDFWFALDWGAFPVLTAYFEHVLQLPQAYHGATHSGRLLKVMLGFMA